MIFTKKMKRLLIVSGVFALIGVILCLVGFFMAKGNSFELFNQKQNDDGQYVYTYEFDFEQIKKISLDLSYVEVSVMSTEEKGRIELINYPIDNFSIAAGATTVSIKEKSSLGSLFSFNFDGFRNYINSFKMASKTREAHIYLPKDSAVKLLDFDIYSGDVIVTDIASDLDFEIELDYGSVAIDKLVTSGNLTVKIDEGNLRIRNSNIYSSSSELKYGYQWISTSKLTDINANIEKGYFKYENASDELLSSVLRLKSENGRVRCFGDIYENGSFTQGMEYTGVSGVVQTVIEVNISDGNIMITE